ncbi:MAG: hypothetical protein ACK40M_14790, partial [Flavobacteriales bacterium]
MDKKNRKASVLIIIVAALGYFVDIYDLVLFGVVKTESLEQIMPGATAAARSDMGKFQMKTISLRLLGVTAMVSALAACGGEKAAEAPAEGEATSDAAP